MLREGWIAPTRNLEVVGDGCAPLDYVMGEARTAKLRRVLCNKFAFGASTPVSSSPPFEIESAQVLKAFAIKGLALAAALAAIWALPAGWATLTVAAIAVATIGFFTYTIVHPRSRFFAPVVSRLATDQPIVA